MKYINVSLPEIREKASNTLLFGQGLRDRINFEVYLSQLNLPVESPCAIKRYSTLLEGEEVIYFPEFLLIDVNE
jgi:hypothetical protein